MRLVRLLPPVLLVALLGCHDGFGIDAFISAYGLSAVDSHALPSLVGATTNCDMMLTDGLLDVSSESYGLTMTVVQDCRRSGGDTSAIFMAMAGAVRASGDTLFLADSGATVSYWSATKSGNALVLNLPADGSYILTPHALTFVSQPFINRH